MRDASTKRETCPQEEAISAAVRTGEWTESLQVHAAECTVCGDILSASQWIRAFSGNATANASENALANASLAADDGALHDSLPDPSVVWWRARMADKQREAEHAHKALAWFEIAAAAAICLGLAGWLAIDRNVLPAATAWLVNEGSSGFWTAVSSIDVLTPVVFSSVVVDIALVAISLAFLVLASD
jgi:hypothetical protein